MKRTETKYVAMDPCRCVACWKCVDQCPRNVIGKAGFLWHRHVAFENADGCIGCGKCEKECPFGAITVTNNVAYIDYKKCRLCRKCVAVCPTGAIHELNFPPRKEAAPEAPKAESVKPAPRMETPVSKETEAPKATVEEKTNQN